MSRVKTFDSTGVAPGGKLFAGDLNSIQDQYADLVNFAQTHGVSVLQIGDTSIQLLKYGTAEARLTGLLRVDGILRGLGGLFAGTFTTAARDAIALGSRPFGLVILNTDTNRLEINKGSDAVPNWQAVGRLAGDIIPAGTLALIPGAGTVDAGTLYFATDDRGGTLYRSTGAAWVQAAAGVVPYAARLSRAAAQSIPNAAETVVTFDTEDIDNDNMHEGVTNPSRLTFTHAGRYTYGGSGFLPAVGNNSYIYARLNAVTKLVGGSIGTALGGGTFADLRDFAAGDYIEMIANHNVGSAQNLTPKLWARSV